MATSYYAKALIPERPSVREKTAPPLRVAERPSVSEKAAPNYRVEITTPDAQLEPKAAKKTTHVLEHPLAQHALSALRDKNTSIPQFRLISQQLLMLLTIEATRPVPLREHRVETAQGSHLGQTLVKPVVFLTVARHGLGLVQNVADLFPHLLVGVISMERSARNSSVEPRLHIASAPILSDASVILFDPVVASGSSAHLAINLVRRAGATNISLISFLFSLPGLSMLQSSFPDLQVYTAGIDTELDPKRGPMPGLGDFAERLYG